MKNYLLSILFLQTLLVSSFSQDVYLYITQPIPELKKKYQTDNKTEVEIPIYKENKMNQVFNYTSLGETMCNPNPSVQEPPT